MGHVTKAVAQYLSDSGVTAEALQSIVSGKVEQAVNACVDRLLRSGRFDTIVTSAVAASIGHERKLYEAGRYGYDTRIRDLVNDKLKELILSDYQVTVTRREKQT